MSEPRARQHIAIHVTVEPDEAIVRAVADRLRRAASAAGLGLPGWPSYGEVREIVQAYLTDLYEAEPEAVLIANCPEHGLHGERDECHVCGRPCEHVPMVALGTRPAHDPRAIFSGGSPPGAPRDTRHPAGEPSEHPERPASGGSGDEVHEKNRGTDHDSGARAEGPGE